MINKLPHSPSLIIRLASNDKIWLQHIVKLFTNSYNELIVEQDQLSIVEQDQLLKVEQDQLSKVEQDQLSKIEITIIAVPIRKRRYTVLRSPHIDKKSRDQWERRTFTYLLIFNTPKYISTALYLLELCHGISITVIQRRGWIV
jgi:hypothetical protein